MADDSAHGTSKALLRQIDNTYDNVAVRLLPADTHPDHDPLCTLRPGNGPLLRESFAKALQPAQALKVLQVGQLTVSVDGSKVLANASKLAAVSCERAGQQIEQWELEVLQLLTKAEQAGATPLQEGPCPWPRPRHVPASAAAKSAQHPDHR